jgi:hypothetical protein
VHPAAVIILELSAVLILLGGLYYVFASTLPPNIRERCGPNGAAQELVRALLRTLGGCLIAIGIAVGFSPVDPYAEAGVGLSLSCCCSSYPRRA